MQKERRRGHKESNANDVVSEQTKSDSIGVGHVICMNVLEEGSRERNVTMKLFIEQSMSWHIEHCARSTVSKG